MTAQSPLRILLLTALAALSPHTQAADRLTRGTLSFESCQIGDSESALGTSSAYCTRLEVPELHGENGGRKITLHIALLPSKADRPTADPVFFLAGGPGQAASEAVVPIIPAFDLIRKTRDVVLMDQRGTGQSHPLECAMPEEEEGESEVDARNRWVKACLTELQKTSDPTAYTTTQTVADFLEALRQAWKAEQVNLLGVSYGTRVAQRYAVTHPLHTRSIVLDSAVPADARLALSTGFHLEGALNARWQACAQQPDCAKRWPNPMKDLKAWLAALKANPQTVSFTHPVTHEQETITLTAERVEDTVRLASYAPETAALIAWWVGQGRLGDPLPLVANSVQMESEVASLSGNVLQMSVLCSEESGQELSPVPEGELLGGRSQRLLEEQCKHWPKGSMPQDFHEPVAITAPALVLQGEWDPATPPVFGEAVMKTLAKGTYLLAKGQGHNVMGRGCMPRLLHDFLEVPEKDLNIECLDRFGALPDALGVHGGRP